MADGQLTLPRDGAAHGPRRNFVWVQGASGYLCAIDGHWRDVREDGRYHSQGYQSVRSFLPFSLHSR